MNTGGNARERVLANFTLALREECVLQVFSNIV
jgi:hypothetical protein